MVCTYPLISAIDCAYYTSYHSQSRSELVNCLPLRVKLTQKNMQYAVVNNRTSQKNARNYYVHSEYYPTRNCFALFTLSTSTVNSTRLVTAEDDVIRTKFLLFTISRNCLRVTSFT